MQTEMRELVSSGKIKSREIPVYCICQIVQGRLSLSLPTFLGGQFFWAPMEWPSNDNSLYKCIILYN